MIKPVSQLARQNISFGILVLPTLRGQFLEKNKEIQQYTCWRTASCSPDLERAQPPTTHGAPLPARTTPATPCMASGVRAYAAPFSDRSGFS